VLPTRRTSAVLLRDDCSAGAEHAPVVAGAHAWTGAVGEFDVCGLEELPATDAVAVAANEAEALAPCSGCEQSPSGPQNSQARRSTAPGTRARVL
jgi:hypothetical protein